MIALDDDALIALARELPAPLPSQTQREELRTAVLAARALISQPREHRAVRAGMLVVGSLASAAALALALFPDTPAAAVPPISVPAPARVAVVHVPPSARFGPPTPVPAPASVDQPVRARSHVVAVAPMAPAPPEPAAPAADEAAYEAAWTALRAGELDRAASGFARAQLLAPDGPLAEDAAYWGAVALARGRRRPEAIVAFRELLATHARSAHAGAASAMLGWLLVEDAPEEAARRFRAAADDPDPEVRASSRAGLVAIQHGDS